MSAGRKSAVLNLGVSSPLPVTRPYSAAREPLSRRVRYALGTPVGEACSEVYLQRVTESRGTPADGATPMRPRRAARLCLRV